jgi:anti-sigma factor RsiW
MTREEMEFLLSQHLDGTLSREDEAKVRELLETSAEAQAVLGEYQKLDSLLKGAKDLPTVKWDVLAERISSAVDAAGKASAVSEEDEFAITEYLDGTLPAEHQAALENRLNAEPGLRAVMEEYRALDGVVKNAMPIPAVKWDVLAERLSESVDAQSQQRRFYIGNWLKQPMRLAAAAMILIAIGVGILIAISNSGNKPVLAVEVVGPEKPAGTGPVVAQVEFDMSPSLAQSGTDWYSAGDVVAMPSTLDVAFTTPAFPDSSSPF